MGCQAGGGGGIAIEKYHFISTGILSIEIRRSHDCLIFTMGIRIAWKAILYRNKAQYTVISQSGPGKDKQFRLSVEQIAMMFMALLDQVADPP